MKNYIKLFFVATFALGVFGCSNSDTYSEPEAQACNDLIATKTVQEVLLLVNNNLNQFNSSFDNDIIEAYVTSSDEGGNFFKSISLVSVDGTKGFSIPVDVYNLYTKFEPGRKVFIKLKGRHYQKNSDSDSPEIGSLYDNGTVATNDDEVGRIAALEYAKVITRSCTKISEDNLVITNLTIAQAKNDSNLNKLIEFNNVQFTDPSVGKKYYDPTLNDLGGATNHDIVDGNGSKIIVRVSSFATFAGNPVSTLNGKVRGVLTKFGSDYQFMVRTINDIQMTNARILPIFEETFTTNFPNWIKQSVIGNQVWNLNTINGNPGNCADMNGFSGGAQQNEDWLISPSIDLTTSPTAFLTFQTSRPFSGANLQAYVSINYSGSGLPSTATWTLLSSAQVATSTTWKDSGTISLAAYLGNPNVRIAFRYTSTNTSAPQWRVDNVKVNPF